MSDAHGKKRTKTTVGFWVVILIIFIVYFLYDNASKLNELIQFYKNYTAEQEMKQEQKAKINKANDLYEKEKLYIVNQEFKSAIPVFFAALKLNPKDKNLQADYIRALIKTSDFITALEEINACPYDDKCSDLLLMLYEKVHDDSMSNGLDMKYLALLISSNSYYTGSNSTLCNTTKLITELATNAVFFAGDKNKKDFKKWIENFNPVNEQDIKRYHDIDVDEYETEFYPWLYWQYSDVNDSKNRINKSSKNVNAYTVLDDTREAAISIANQLMDNRTIENFFDARSCSSLEANELAYTYFETYFSGMLRGSKGRLLEFDTTDKLKVSKLTNHIESVFTYTVFNTLYTHCVTAERC